MGAGLFLGFLSGAAALASFLILYVWFQDMEPSERGAEIILALMLMFLPIVAALVIFVVTAALLRGSDRTKDRLTMITGGLVLGLSLLLLAGPMSIANDCEFDVTLPYPFYKDACD